MCLERNIHFPANNFDQIRGFASGLGIADDGLAVVDGQMTLHSDGDGASVVHVVDVVTVDNVADVLVLDDAVFIRLPYKFAYYLQCVKAFCSCKKKPGK
jgi:hypothetical protein